MSKVRVTVTYTEEFNFSDGNAAKMERIVKAKGQEDRLVEYIQIGNPPIIEYSDEESRKKKEMQERIEEITCNSGEGNFPEDPVQFLKDYPNDYWDEESEEHPGKCIIIWHPFEDYVTQKLIGYLEGRGLWNN